MRHTDLLKQRSLTLDSPERAACRLQAVSLKEQGLVHGEKGNEIIECVEEQQRYDVSGVRRKARGI